TIPQALRERDQWVLWRLQQRKDKPTKVPYQPNGKLAACNRPATWSSYEDAVAVAHRFDGIGYVFAADDPNTGVDFDDCLAGGATAASNGAGRRRKRRRVVVDEEAVAAALAAHPGLETLSARRGPDPSEDDYALACAAARDGLATDLIEQLVVHRLLRHGDP